MIHNYSFGARTTIGVVTWRWILILGREGELRYRRVLGLMLVLVRMLPPLLLGDERRRRRRMSGRRLRMPDVARIMFGGRGWKWIPITTARINYGCVL